MSLMRSMGPLQFVDSLRLRERESPMVRWNPLSRMLILISSATNHSTPSESLEDLVLDLQPGEWVEVRSPEEIFSTLNLKFMHKGMGFMPEMLQSCGKKYRVYKKVEKIVLETTGESRIIKTPTVFLEGNFCDGSFHDGCDRSCFCFWREAWLKRVPPPE
jgi:hypothetical protein